MGKAGRKLRVPKAKMEGINVKALQSLLFYKKEFPEYFNKYSDSKELMMIFKLLVAQPSAIENGLNYKLDVQEKLHHIFGTDYRQIFTYEVIEDFVLNVGEVSYNEEMPEGQTPRKLRALYRGDVVLIRVDSRDEDLMVDLQVLTAGLFQDTSDDFRNFRMNTSDIAQFRSKLKLVDKDGQDEETFIGDTRR
jgi:hypothetical protein